MSLSWVHVVFISLSILVMAGFGLWGLGAFAARRAIGDLLLGSGALLSSLGLAVYARAFVRKIRRQHL